MPLPMVHLAAAIELGKRAKQFPSPAFLLGSIAPDSIHMRSGANGDSKVITHLNSPEDTADHDRVREMLIQQTALPGFAAGYAAHVLTDRLWEDSVVIRFRDAVGSDLDDAARRSLYYRETDQVDCNLYHQMPWRPEVWKCLEQTAAPDFPPLLSSLEITQWRDRTLHWFEDPQHEPHIVPRTIRDELVQNFVEDAVQKIEICFNMWQIVDFLA